MNYAKRVPADGSTRRVRLGEVLTLVNGRAYSQSELLEQGTPVIRIQNLNGGDKWYFSNLDLPEDKYCDHGDLLFAWSATFGPYIWSGGRSIYHYHIWKVIPGPELDKQFAFYLLQSITEKVKAAGRGISMIHMTKGGMEAWEVTLPPLEEQRRIAAVLDKADELRRKRKRALELLDTLSQSIFLDMFGDPVSNDRQWPLKMLGEIATSRLGKMLDQKKTVGLENFPYLANYNVQWDRFELRELRQMGFSDDERQEFELVSGDLLVCEGGEIGRCAIWRGEIAGCYFQKALHRVRVDADTCTSEFLLWYFRFMAERGGLDAHTSAATIPHLTGVKLRSLCVPLPPIGLQRLFSKIALAIRGQRNRVAESEEVLASLFASLQHRAFSGQL